MIISFLLVAVEKKVEKVNEILTETIRLGNKIDLNQISTSNKFDLNFVKNVFFEYIRKYDIKGRFEGKVFVIEPAKPAILKSQRDILNKKDMYVPVDFSDLKEVIPIGDEIIYSTLCNAFIDFSYYTEGIGFIPRYKTWNTHVLFTNSGVAFWALNFSADRRQNIYTSIYYRPTYKRWHEISKIEKEKFIVQIFVKKEASKEEIDLDYKFDVFRKNIDFTFVRDPKYESEESFRYRTKMFAGRFISLMRSKKKEAGAECVFIGHMIRGAFFAYFPFCLISYILTVVLNRFTWEILLIGVLLGGFWGFIIREIELRSQNQLIKYYQEHKDLVFEKLIES